MSKMVVKGYVDVVNQTHERSTRISKNKGMELVDRSKKIEYQNNGCFGTLILYGIKDEVIYTVSFLKDDL